MVNKSQDIGYFLEVKKMGVIRKEHMGGLLLFFPNFLLWKILQIEEKLKE